MKAKLILENGRQFAGTSFGYEHPTSGEVVFNTSMCGYPESLTDPSYIGEILALTYPLAGNYGVPAGEFDKYGLSRFFESEKIHVRALVISNCSEHYSHWNAGESLSSWLKQQKIPAISNIDTRALTKLLRENGSMLGQIVFDGDSPVSEIYNPADENLVSQASCKRVMRYNEGGEYKIALVDCGVKHNIIRCLLKRNVEVIRVPWDYDFAQINFDGLFVSNGPGNPEYCTETVENIRKTLNGNKPVFGICMGNQLLSLASGAKTYRLKYGHRSHNQPVQMLTDKRCFVTSQNHGYAVDNTTLGNDWKPLFVNLNDGTNEGIRHKTKPFFSAQFHPEAASGPVDTEFLFDEFLKKISESLL
ncbi:MAG: glutamine-hydrolyzing carbamoyl-phosphate synthase small subunit [Prevotellaceae bacterium]|jgi:carbamoyl-phosphate synthase small subunit|nr:glutamine-hydrolyzing carbamoyl-phosphate synthase small subunit [Prevotellaceae bacterium]